MRWIGSSHYGQYCPHKKMPTWSQKNSTQYDCQSCKVHRGLWCNFWTIAINYKLVMCQLFVFCIIQTISKYIICIYRSLIPLIIAFYTQNSNSCIFATINNWTHAYRKVFTQKDWYYNISNYLLFLLKHHMTSHWFLNDGIRSWGSSASLTLSGKTFKHCQYNYSVRVCCRWEGHDKKRT